jgi:D-alanyl-D-alanine carboxypeptidase
MRHTTAARGETSRARRLVLPGLAAVIAGIIAALGYQVLASSSSTGELAIPARTTPSALTSSAAVYATSTDARLRPEPPARQRADLAQGALPSEHRGALGAADGVVPVGTSVFDDELPAVANLDRGLLKALQRAATDAAKDGVEFVVTSGWRSAEYQKQLLSEAVSEFGSEEEAARWVATPDTSAHVSGNAVDIGPLDAVAWLSKHGARYGLCQIYRNEPWHYELRRIAPDPACPRMYADPRHDPRMQQ